MTLIAALAAALALVAAPAAAQTLAQANGNLPPGAIANGAGAKLNAAEGTQPDGVPLPEGTAAQGQRTATDRNGTVTRTEPAAGTKPAP